MTDRRYDGERRIGERVAALETNDAAQDRTLESVAPVAVHLAEINLLYKETKEGIDRIEGRFDNVEPRLRKLEYAVLLLIGAAVSPKLGGPAVPDLVSSVVSYLT